MHAVEPVRSLILDDDPSDYLAALQRDFPMVRFECCQRGHLAQEHAQRFQPHIVLSHKNPQISGAEMRLAMRTPSVAWIHVCGAGFDHIMPIDDLPATLTNAVGVLSEYLAETMLGMMITLSLGFPGYFHQQRKRHWQTVERRSLIGATVLVVGLGHVGRAVAARCHGAGMRVLGIRNRAQQPGQAIPCVEHVALPEQLLDMLPQADYVCLHTPLTDTTKNWFGPREFAAMKPGSYFLNAARGGIVDEAALYRALANGHLHAAYSDVFATEPLPPDDPLWELPNLIISPHCADAIGDWKQRYITFFRQNLQRWLAGEPLHNIVAPNLGY